MNESQAIARLIANKHQRSPFRQTEFIGQQKKARDPEADRAAWERHVQERIKMATGQK